MHDFKASPLKFHCLSQANKICETAGNKKGQIIYIYPCSKGNLRREFKATHALLSFLEMTSAALFSPACTGSAQFLISARPPAIKFALAKNCHPSLTSTHTLAGASRKLHQPKAKRKLREYSE